MSSVTLGPSSIPVARHIYKLLKILFQTNTEIFVLSQIKLILLLVLLLKYSGLTCQLTFIGKPKE